MHRMDNIGNPRQIGGPAAQKASFRTVCVNNLYLFSLENRRDLPQGDKIPPEMNGVLKFRKKISFAVFNFFSFGVQITAHTGNENNFELLTVMVVAAIKGVLLGAAQFQTGNNVGDFNALSHSTRWIQTGLWKTRLEPDLFSPLETWLFWRPSWLLSRQLSLVRWPRDPLQ